jgi:hypothetical protein
MNAIQTSLLSLILLSVGLSPSASASSTSYEHSLREIRIILNDAGLQAQFKKSTAAPIENIKRLIDDPQTGAYSYWIQAGSCETRVSSSIIELSNSGQSERLTAQPLVICTLD